MVLKTSLFFLPGMLVGDFSLFKEPEANLSESSLSLTFPSLLRVIPLSVLPLQWRKSPTWAALLEQLSLLSLCVCSAASLDNSMCSSGGHGNLLVGAAKVATADLSFLSPGTA